jgi:hypothetical protein
VADLSYARSEVVRRPSAADGVELERGEIETKWFDEPVDTQVFIPVDWIARELGYLPATVLEWADRLGIKRRTDDSGRECVAEPDGRRIIEEARLAGRAAAELHEAFQRYLDRWDEEWREAGEDAYRRALTEQYQHQVNTMPKGFAFYGGGDRLGPGPQARAFANAKAAEARVAWERKNPRKDFDSFEKQWRKKR